MGKPTGFMEYKRELPPDRQPLERIKDWNEFHEHFSDEKQQLQGARCMDCGIPFCHSGLMINNAASGCPINNLIPEWNDLIYRGRWREAWERLRKTNNFAEFTGRVCPAPCEGACTVGIKAGSHHSHPTSARARRSPSSVQDPLAWPAPTSSTRQAMRLRSMSEPTALADS